MPIATVSATSSTSIFSRQAALGYGLSHLLAICSRFSICFSRASRAEPCITALCNAETPPSMAWMACGDRISRWWLRSFWTCFLIAVACRTVGESNHATSWEPDPFGGSCADKSSAGAGAFARLDFPGGFSKSRFLVFCILQLN